MQRKTQVLEELVRSLSPLTVDWQDETATKAIARLTKIQKKASYDRNDIDALLSEDFTEGILCARLFLALSKDSMEAALRNILGNGIGVTRYNTDSEAFLTALELLGHCVVHNSSSPHKLPF